MDIRMPVPKEKTLPHDFKSAYETFRAARMLWKYTRRSYKHISSDVVGVECMKSVALWYYTAKKYLTIARYFKMIDK